MKYPVRTNILCCSKNCICHLTPRLAHGLVQPQTPWNAHAASVTGSQNTSGLHFIQMSGGTSHVLHAPSSPTASSLAKNFYVLTVNNPNQLTQTGCQPGLNDSLLVCVCVNVCVSVSAFKWQYINPFKMMSVGPEIDSFTGATVYQVTLRLPMWIKNTIIHALMEGVFGCWRRGYFVNYHMVISWWL